MLMLDPDDFAGNPYGHVTNQAGHAQFVGMPLAMLGLLSLPPVAVPVLVALVYFTIWEAIIQRGRMWADSLMDTACTMAGASIICAAFYFIADFWPAWITVTLCWLAYAAVVLWGGLRRYTP